MANRHVRRYVKTWHTKYPRLFSQLLPYIPGFGYTEREKDVRSVSLIVISLFSQPVDKQLEYTSSMSLLTDIRKTSESTNCRGTS